ncbi:biopolymer transporter ExbD [Polyangium sp. 6x1]|uniref:ExbD/TolR family protein n=1 Tax=Polyangium sp. 6x1 TaxID=3042689 RepID=UPI00248258ED|nr:biopolymer transporter ExbD [Polyangium sp. 6x1]MDI1449761.1 biopolymer transporter ExbD [Polyangium sp. 6x1]
MLRLLRRRPDPDAHVIRPPGPRLLRRIALRFFQCPPRAWRTLPGVRAPVVLAFILPLACYAFGLFPAFSASGECCGPLRLPGLPAAFHGEDIVDAPMVVVDRHHVTVDGVVVAETPEIIEAVEPVQLDELRALLVNKKELWRQVRPDAPFPGEVLIAAGKDLPASAVLRVMASAAAAGYPRASFMVQKLYPPLRK